MSLAPKVSIVVPAYRSDGTVEAFLEGLREQTFRDFELVVVNSTPDDGTGAAVARLLPEATYVESRTRLLPHEARNRGVEAARGSILTFTDPDCRPRPDWLDRIVAAHGRGHRAVTGAMSVARDVSWFERGVHLCKFWWALPGRADGPAWVAPSANASYERALWDAIGPFPSGFSGDAVLGWRATAAGAQPWFASAAIVEHRHAGGFGGLWRERLLRGREFGVERARHEHWTRARLAAAAAAAPVLPPLVLARAARASGRVGWTKTFVATLPVQLTGQAAWSLGETAAFVRLLRRESSAGHVD